MRALLLLAALSGVAAGGPGCASTPAGGDPPPPAPGRPATPSPSLQKVVPGEYVVTFAPPATADLAREVLARYAPTKAQELGNGMVLVGLAEDPGLPALQELQGRDARIRAVQPNFVYSISR